MVKYFKVLYCAVLEFCRSLKTAKVKKKMIKKVEKERKKDTSNSNFMVEVELTEEAGPEENQKMVEVEVKVKKRMRPIKYAFSLVEVENNSIYIGTICLEKKEECLDNYSVKRINR